MYNNKIPKLLNIYLWYYLLSFIIGYILSGRYGVPLGWIKVYILYSFVFSLTNIRILYKYYSIVSYFSIGFLFIQIFFDICGLKINGIISFLPLSLDNMTAGEYIENTLKDNWRICSFFSEPAKFAQYLMPLLIFTLYNQKIKHRTVKIIIICLSFLILKSGNALIILSIIIITYLFHLLRKSSLTKKIILIIISVLVLGSSTIVYLRTEAASSIIERQSELDNTTLDRSSGFIRIYRGYYVYAELSNLEKLIGANNPILMDRAIKNSPVSFMFEENDYYYNTVQNILIKTGIIGMLIFIIFLFKLYTQASSQGKAIIICMIAISFLASMYLSYLMLLYFVFAYNYKSNLLSYEEGRNNYHTYRY